MILADSPVIEIAAGTVDDSEAQEVYRNLQVLYGTHTGEQALDRDFGIDISMQSMLKEQEKQGNRLEVLEGRDGEKWRKVMGYIATAIVGVVLGYLFKQIGM